MPKYPVQINGQEVEIDAATPAEAARRAYTQFRLEQRAQEPPPTPQDIMRKGIVESGFGTSMAATPEQRVGRAALGARLVAPMVTPNPFLAGAASGAAETVAQAAEQGMGMREGFNPWQIGLSTILPPVVAGGTRLVRGARNLYRSTAGFPSQQEAARESARGVGQAIGPTEAAAPAFAATREAARAGETVAVPQLKAIIERLDEQIPTEPASKALQAVRDQVGRFQGALKPDGTMPLAQLDQLRLDLSSLLREGGHAPQLVAISGAIGRDLAAAPAATGAAAYATGLAQTRLGYGADKWDALIAKHTKVVEGAESLNMPGLMRELLQPKVQDEFTRLAGPEGMAAIRQFTSQYRGLPAKQASYGLSLIASALGLTGGVATAMGTGAIGPVTGAVGGAALMSLPILIREALRVGPNSPAMNMGLATAAQAARTYAGGDAEPRPQDVERLNLRIRELQRVLGVETPLPQEKH